MKDEIPELLLISDLDDTLLGNPPALDRFGEFISQIYPRITIAYATGRFFDSVYEDVTGTALPEPVAVIGGVGSEIRHFPEGNLDQTWIEQISRNWSAKTVRDIMATEEDVELQPEEFQSEFKVSYYYNNAPAVQLNRLHTRILEAGIDSTLVYSSQRDLDFMPRGVHKGTAAAFLARKLGFPSDRVVVAGNSGNDSKLFEQDFFGIIVANAHDELKQLVDDSKNYLSPHSHAEGVRDGLQHWIREIRHE